MKILLIVDDYLPSNKSVSLMMHQLAVELHHRGHVVIVATPSSIIADNVEISSSNGVSIIRFRSGCFKNTGRIQRAVNESLFSLRLLQTVQKHPEVFAGIEKIIYYSPSIFWGPAVLRLKKKYHASSYLILRDIFPQWCIDRGFLTENGPICLFFKYFERLNYRAADKIGVQTPNSMQYFAKRNEDMNRFEVLQNWFDPSFELPVIGTSRKDLHLEDKVIFFYGGNIGNAQDMLNIARLARNLRNYPKAHFLLIGKGDEYDLLMQKKQEWALDNLTLLPAVSQTEFFQILQEIDVGLITLHPSHQTQNFPGKLLSYMVCSKPILGSINANNDTIDIINSAGAGLISVNPDDDSFFVNAKRLLENESFRKNCGENSRKLLETEFSVSAVANKLLRDVEIENP